MTRTPKAGEPYQVCPHLAAAPTSPDRHFWDMPGRKPWIVLCSACHGAFQQRRSVEIYGETFHLSEDIAIEPGSSSVSHCAPGDLVSEPDSPRAKPAAPAPPGKLLLLPMASQDPAWLPLAEKALGALTALWTSYQQHEQAREALRLQRMELENRALEQFANALESSIHTIDRLHAISIEREHAIAALVRRVAELPPPHRY